MNKFITFNTIAQANQYVKRAKSYGHNEGCGCCWNYVEVKITKDRIVSVYSGSFQGEYFTNYTVIGKIKKQ